MSSLGWRCETPKRFRGSLMQSEVLMGAPGGKDGHLSSVGCGWD